MPSGPRPARIVVATVGCSPAAGVAVAVAVAAASVPETNCATALISAADSRPENDGMPPAPEVTICWTRSALGLASSRFGPAVPDEPAAASVWQPPQPADAKTALPAGAAAGRGRVAVARLLVGADQRRAREQHEDRERRGQPGQRGQDAVDLRQHYGEGNPLLEMNQRPLVSHTPTRSVNSVPPASGSAIPGSECERTTTTLTANAP